MVKHHTLAANNENSVFNSLIFTTVFAISFFAIIQSDPVTNCDLKHLITHITQPNYRLVEHRDLGVAAHVAAAHCDGFGQVVGAFPAEHFRHVSVLGSGTMTLPTCWRPFSPQYHIKKGCAP